jgi:DNA ligase-1
MLKELESQDENNAGVLQKLYNLCKQLKATTSSNMKKEILTQYKDEKEVLELLHLIHNNLINFYVTSANLKKRGDLLSLNTHTSIFSLLNDLKNRRITGDAALLACNSFIYEQPDHIQEMLYNLLDRDLKIKIGASLINEVFPNLIPEFKVALAKNYTEYRNKINFSAERWFFSRKFDGLRLITIVDNGNISFFSRVGNEFKTLEVLRQHLQKVLPQNISRVLDGELGAIDANGDEQFQTILGDAKRKDFIIEHPMYHIFDMLTINEFYSQKSDRTLVERHYDLLNLLENSSYIEIVNQTEVKSNEDLEEQQIFAIQNGWEGLIIRKDVPYEGKRTKNMLKVKEFKDAEYKVINAEFGKFPAIVNNENILVDALLSVTIVHKENQVNVGSGFTIDQRKYYYENPEQILNKIIKVKYFEETTDSDGIHSLRFPIFLGNYGDKREE